MQHKRVFGGQCTLLHSATFC